LKTTPFTEAHTYITIYGSDPLPPLGESVKDEQERIQRPLEAISGF